MMLRVPVMGFSSRMLGMHQSVVGKVFGEQVRQRMSTQRSSFSTDSSLLQATKMGNALGTSPKVYPGDKAPDLSFSVLDSDNFTLSANEPEYFTIVVFYRGKHCPLCRRYLKEIDGLYGKAKEEGVDVVAVSMDTKERARETVDMILKDMGKESLELPIGYGLSEEVAHQWGLFISEARPESSEPAVFSEPGLFVIQPDDVVYSEVIQSNPWTRPEFSSLLGGIAYVVANNYPIRGTLTKQ